MYFSSKASSRGYIDVQEKMNWTEAQSYCRQHHTDLASVRNQSENNEIKDFIKRNVTSPDEAWIGLNRLWVWSDNSSSTFTHWLPDEPNSPSKSDICTSIDIPEYKGQWLDDECKENYLFVCYDGK